MTVDVWVNLSCRDASFVEVNNPVPDVITMNEERDHIVVVSRLVMAQRRENTSVNRLHPIEVPLSSRKLLQSVTSSCSMFEVSDSSRSKTKLAVKFACDRLTWRRLVILNSLQWRLLHHLAWPKWLSTSGWPRRLRGTTLLWVSVLLPLHAHRIS